MSPQLQNQPTHRPQTSLQSWIKILEIHQKEIVPGEIYVTIFGLVVKVLEKVCFLSEN